MNRFLSSIKQNISKGKLILQGAEDGFKEIKDGVGWSMAISRETGKMVLTESGDQVAFVVFGARVLR